MQLIPAFNPTANGTAVGSNGIVLVGAADAGSKMLLYNESQVNLALDFYNGNQGMLHAWEARFWTLDGDTRQVGWSVESVLNQPDPPISSVKGELYGPQEKVEGTYPISLVRQTSTAGTVNTVTSSSTFTSVKDAAYGAVGDGISDDTTAIANARAAVNAAGGGIVFYPKGVYITGNLIDYDNVTDMGSGPGATVLRLKAGSNTDLFGSRFTANINLTAASGSGSANASTGWHLRDMTLDGNKANQSGGTSYCIRAYAYGYNLTNLECINGYTGGRLVDYNGPFPSNSRLEHTWVNTRDLWHNGIGVQCGGPTDGHWLGGFVAFSASHNIHATPHCSQMECEDVHAYTNSPQPNTNACAWLIEAGITCVNCIAETSGAVQIALITNNIFRWIGGSIFAGSYAGIGIQIGQAAGNTPFLGQINQAAGVTTALSAAQYDFEGIMLQNIANVNGYIRFVSDGGGRINYIAYKPGGSPAVFTGTKSTRTTIMATVLGSTPNQTLENDGGIAAQGPIAMTLTSIDIAGDTSGFARCYEDEQGTIKRVYITLDNYKHVGAAQPQFILPVPFIKGGLIRAGNTNTQVACWQGVTARNINVVTSFVGTATVQGNIGPYQWGDITDTFDRVLLPALMGSTVANGVIIIEGH